MENTSESTLITLHDKTWPEYRSELRLSILFSDGKRQGSLRRTAGRLQKHFENDYNSPNVDTTGLDRLGLSVTGRSADIELLSNGSLEVDLLVKASDGDCYSIKEADGREEIYSPSELLERALSCRTGE